MTGIRFCRYDLRTLDPAAAQAFYAEVVGLDLPGADAREEPAGLRVWPLHEQARARGAPPHWLGQLGVTDLDATIGRLVEQGSERLGPTVRANDGTSYATLRDPSGAVLAVQASITRPSSSPVAWHHLHTKDLDRAWALYAEIFGWTHTETLEVADLVGGYRMFAWDDDGPSVGSIANTGRWPGVHAHWLFYFPVGDLDAALAKVEAKGGRISALPAALPHGARLAPCEDPQGAAFGLLQPPGR
jgi:predicted enzyme related to lactoylglutathione lyase